MCIRDSIMDVIYLFGFWTSGIFFKGDKFLEYFPPLYYLNPYVGILINFRAIVLDSDKIDHFILIINLLTALVIFVLGRIILRRVSHLVIERI